ncbi:ferredoxin reductase [Rhodococcus rhodnii]|uniref:Oxidoreductase n=2 Tax=Rhodococcus rhodnii TaxID=38312 RepID=R7WJA4_9NOCA|nr:ferredoxin reductase [Rhodococcus rhodnii]EOM75361.1 oxidoreductase [Rhodococcus rhodnii LMG 5362]TXG90591.1 ferredoxin reductase [Rhodococcus rhodnii]
MGLKEWVGDPATARIASRGAASWLRHAAVKLTTPLLPDDYLHLVNPLWSARELRGRIVEVRRETSDCATIVIKPGWGFDFGYRAGQYIGIGLLVDGRWHWRSYSLTSPAGFTDDLISITVKAMPEGLLSTHLVGGVPPGTVVRLAAPTGNFALPEPPPERILFVTAGSGITPVMSMLRTAARRGSVTDVVHVHSAPTEDDVIFGDELRALAAEYPSYRPLLRSTRTEGKISPADLDELVPDWRERDTWACGPLAMLDAYEAHFAEAGLEDRLNLERFAVSRADISGEGGTVTFTRSGRTRTVDGATTLLEAGEDAGVLMPFGCRMGICQTCVVPIESGHAVDLRTGRQHAEGERVQTCVSAAAGDCTLDV